MNISKRFHFVASFAWDDRSSKKDEKDEVGISNRKITKSVEVGISNTGQLNFENNNKPLLPCRY